MGPFRANLGEFRRRLAEERCWIDGACTHRSHARQRQCPQCRRKWSFGNTQRHWRLAELFCAPSDPEFERGRHRGASPDNFGPGNAFTVSDPARQVIDRVQATVLLNSSSVTPDGKIISPAGYTIHRNNKTLRDSRSVGRIYTEFELLMVLEYFSDDIYDDGRAILQKLLLNRGMQANRLEDYDDGVRRQVLRETAQDEPALVRKLLDAALLDVWKQPEVGYEGRLEILYRRFFVPKLQKLGVDPCRWDGNAMHSHQRSGPSDEEQKNCSP